MVVHTPLFNERSTYVVTGGLSGIGFEVARYLLANGAKHLALLSRSSAKPDKISQIATWTAAGKHVEAFSVDVGDFEQCRSLFQHLKSPASEFPPVRGIMHAAGVLRDNLVENQSWDSFRYTFKPKVAGTWNLHELTKELLLEHFVVFSSIASLLGNRAQTNHSSSNSFQDGFANYRRCIGLQATSINWGIWGEVGVASEVDIPGLRPISTVQGISALDKMLRTQRSHLAAFNCQSFSALQTVFPSLKAVMDDKRLLGEVKTTTLLNSDSFWASIDAAESHDAKLSELTAFIIATVKTILKMERSEEIGESTEFQALGVDSLMQLELKNSLQAVLGQRLVISTALMKEGTSATTLAASLVKVLQGKESEMLVPAADSV